MECEIICQNLTFSGLTETKHFTDDALSKGRYIATDIWSSYHPIQILYDNVTQTVRSGSCEVRAVHRNEGPEEVARQVRAD